MSRAGQKHTNRVFRTGVHIILMNEEVLKVYCNFESRHEKKSFCICKKNKSAGKTEITLTPPTVSRPSADDQPIYRPIKCQILALFSSADKNKIITTLL